MNTPTIDWREKILPLKAQAEHTNRWLEHRLEHILPEIMQREGFDMWIVCAREYNEDPVMMSLLPAPMLSARRRTILVFSRQGESVESLNIARPGIGLDKYYRGVWENRDESQWDCLKRVVRERDPKRIGINSSDTFAFGDGLSHHEYTLLKKALGSEFEGRLVSAERLCVGWLERRTPAEMETAVGINQIAHAIIAEAFSSRVVHPHLTTADDVAWWMRQRIHDLGLRAWFHPTVSIQRQGVDLGDIGKSAAEIIRPGDLLHCDMGFIYLGLATDTQQHAYVLKLGETDVPRGLKHSLARANRLQDILADELRAGRSGNEILALSLAKMAEEAIDGRIYAHPIGYHGHGAGPTIGLYDNQTGVPGRGDYPLHNDVMLSSELYAQSSVAEWQGRAVKIALEQTTAFTGGRLHYLAGRQTDFHLIQ